MYPNLLGQKVYYHLCDQDMAKIIGVSRSSYCQKLRTGNFYPDECRAYCRYFDKPFHYLFATEGELTFFLGNLPGTPLPVMAAAR